MSRHLIGLGQAFEIQFKRLNSTKKETVSFPGYWWAWDGTPTGGDIRLVRVVSVGGKRLSSAAKSAHKKFHGEAPHQAVTVDDKPMGAPLRTFARVIAIGYDARGYSVSKDDAPYRHHFGAFDHDDKPPFHDDALPDLALDRHGQLIIKRRPSNTFRLDDWLIG